MRGGSTISTDENRRLTRRRLVSAFPASANWRSDRSPRDPDIEPQWADSFIGWALPL